MIATPLHLMPTTATVIVPSETISSMGERTLTYGSGVSVQCRIHGVSASDAREWLRTTGKVVFKGMFAKVNTAGAAVSLPVNTKVTADGMTFMVLGPGRDSSASNTMTIVNLEVVT